MGAMKGLLILAMILVIGVGAADLIHRSLPPGGSVGEIAKNIVVVSSDRAEAAQDRERDVVFPVTPSYLKIPAIGVAADVQHVGVAASGNMAVPTNYSDVGWYRDGSRPGEAGHAVFAGHVDNGIGLKAVFGNLHKLSSGDEIIVGNGSGEIRRFAVTENVVVDLASFPAEDVFRNEGEAGLVLITCDGAWNSAANEYEKRRIIYARPVTR